MKLLASMLFSASVGSVCGALGFNVVRMVLITAISCTCFIVTLEVLTSK